MTVIFLVQETQGQQHPAGVSGAGASYPFDFSNKSYFWQNGEGDAIYVLEPLLPDPGQIPRTFVDSFSRADEPVFLIQLLKTVSY